MFDLVVDYQVRNRRQVNEHFTFDVWGKTVPESKFRIRVQVYNAVRLSLMSQTKVQILLELKKFLSPYSLKQNATS